MNSGQIATAQNSLATIIATESTPVRVWLLPTWIEINFAIGQNDAPAALVKLQSSSFAACQPATVLALENLIASIQGT